MTFNNEVATAILFILETGRPRHRKKLKGFTQVIFSDVNKKGKEMNRNKVYIPY